MKHKRVWTDEQRQAAAERARVRFTKKPTYEVIAELNNQTTAVLELPEEQKIRAPEVQAVIDTMDPARKAKLAGIQARQLAQLSQTKEGQEALQRLEARHTTAVIPESQMPGHTTPQASVIEPQPVPTTRTPVVREIPMKGPFRITGSQSGMCVSEMGPCQCGEPKLKWHPICLKVKV